MTEPLVCPRCKRPVSPTATSCSCGMDLSIVLGPTVPDISSFGEDAAGELYVLSLDGGIYRLTRG